MPRVGEILGQVWVDREESLWTRSLKFWDLVALGVNGGLRDKEQVSRVLMVLEEQPHSSLALNTVVQHFQSRCEVVWAFFPGPRQEQFLCEEMQHSQAGH